jgi:hypothetical protein
MEAARYPKRRHNPEDLDLKVYQQNQNYVSIKSEDIRENTFRSNKRILTDHLQIRIHCSLLFHQLVVILHSPFFVAR